MTTSVYYPYLEPPLDWLKSYLLFHDQIARIVPPNIDELEGDEDFKRFRDAFPGAIRDIPSSEELIDLDPLALDRLERAFAKIAGDMSRLPFPQFTTGREGKRKRVFMSIPGFSYLHRSKVSKEVYALFNEYGLAPDPYQRLIASKSRDEFIWVKEEAANLVMALLADRVARDEAIDSVTNEPLDFCVLALNGLGTSKFSGTVPGGHVDKLLAQAVISIHVPKAINDISLEDYKEIRMEFLKVRESFDNLIKEQLSVERLEADPTLLKRHLEEATKSISEKLEKVGRTEHKRFLQHWAPFTIVSLLGIAAAFPISTPIAIGLAAVAATIEFVDKVISPIGATDRQARLVHRKLAKLNDRLISKEVSRLTSELL